MAGDGVAANGSPARLLLADDHALVREGLRAVLEAQEGIEVVGEAQDGPQAVELCQKLSPDLVLMDVRMPRMDGLEATRVIKRELPRIIVLVLSAFEDPNYLSKALKAGAAGYVLKTAPPTETIAAVRKALIGELPLNQEVAVRLLMRLMEQAPKEEALPESLSLREIDVLRLMARGQTNQQIAKNLFVSTSTIKKHVHSIISKLGVSDRTQAALRAVELGVLDEREGE